MNYNVHFLYTTFNIISNLAIVLGGSRGIGSLVRYFVANEVKWCELISIGSWLAPSLASLSTSSLLRSNFLDRSFMC